MLTKLSRYYFLFTFSATLRLVLYWFMKFSFENWYKIRSWLPCWLSHLALLKSCQKAFLEFIKRQSYSLFFSFWIFLPDVEERWQRTETFELSDTHTYTHIYFTHTHIFMDSFSFLLTLQLCTYANTFVNTCINC